MSSVQTLPLLNVKNWKLIDVEQLPDRTINDQSWLTSALAEIVCPLTLSILYENLLSKLSVKAIFTHNHCFPFPCCWECLTLTRLFQKADWTRLCFTLSKSFCLCALHLTGVAKVVIYQKPITLNTKGNQRILKISESEWTDRNDGWSTSGQMTSVRSSGECEFLAELSTFDL